MAEHLKKISILSFALIILWAASGPQLFRTLCNFSGCEKIHYFEPKLSCNDSKEDMSTCHQKTEVAINYKSDDQCCELDHILLNLSETLQNKLSQYSSHLILSSYILIKHHLTENLIEEEKATYSNIIEEPLISSFYGKGFLISTRQLKIAC
ncbi:MAG: hypothetical protein ACEPOV_07190 [Hyphomicrobiales bacterium]